MFSSTQPVIYAMISSEHYTKSHNIFRKYTRQTQGDIEVVQNHFPSLIKKTMASFDFRQRSQFNILSVGGGTGEVDAEIIKTARQELENTPKWSRIHIFNRTLEPNEDSRQLCRKAIAQIGDSQTSFEVRPETFQQYQASKREPNKFDIVHFVHSLYYVDFEETLLHCLEHEMTEKGCFVSIMDDNSLINWVLEKQGEHALFKDRNHGGVEKSRRLTQIAEKHGFKYEMHSQNYLMEVTDLMDEKSIEGNLLLDFLTQTENFRRVACKELVEETLALIDRMTVIKEKKRLYEGTTESLVLIYK